MTLRRSSCLVPTGAILALIFGLTAAPGESRAQNRPRGKAVTDKAGQAQVLKARKLYERGLELFATERYSEAVDIFLEAYQVRPVSGLLFNAGQAAAKAKRFGQARELLQRFLANPPVPRPDEPSRDLAQDLRRARELLAEVERAIPGRLVVRSEPPGARVYLDTRALGSVGKTPYSGELASGAHVVIVELDGHQPEKREVTLQPGREATLEVRLGPALGTLNLSSAVPGAEVLVDGQRAGVTPVGALALPAGDHTIEVRHPGYRSFSRQVRLVPGQSQSVEAELVVAEAPRRSLRPWFWTTLALGTAATAAGIACAVLTRSKVDELEQARGEFGPSYRGIQSSGETYSRATIGTFTAGGALLVTALVLGLVEPRRQERPATALTEENAPPRLTAAPVVAPGQYGLSAQLRF